MSLPQLILFDCDGVLIDSEHLSLGALVEALAQEYGIEMTLEEALFRYVGRSAKHEEEDLAASYGIKVSDAFKEKKKKLREKFFEEKLEAIPGIHDFLAKLPIKKCVASSSAPERLRHSLGLTGLWESFAPHVFSATQVKNGKPAPDLFLFAAEQMKVLPSACLVIEDSVAGVQAAKAAQMRVYGFVGGSHCGEGHADVLVREGAERVFHSMYDLANALDASLG